LEGAHQPVARDAELLENPARGPAVVGERQQDMLDRDVLVLEALGLVLGHGEQALEPARDIDLIGRAGRGGNLRELVELLLEPAVDPLNIHLCFQQDSWSQAPLLLEQGGEEMLDVDLLVGQANGLGLSRANGFLQLFGEAVDIHRERPPFVADLGSV